MKGFKQNSKDNLSLIKKGQSKANIQQRLLEEQINSQLSTTSSQKLLNKSLLLPDISPLTKAQNTFQKI